LHRPIGLLLDDDRSVANILPGDNVANLDLHQIAAAELAVDGKIKERLVSQPALAIEMEADRPDLLLSKRTLGPHVLTSVPGCTSLHRRVKS
jgi:hypothetical protein